MGSLLILLSNAGLTFAGTPSSVLVGANPPAALFGRQVTLTAAVTPAQATGVVTFYDGTSVLGSANLSGGQASFITSGIGYGKRQITAKYTGNSTYSGSLSPAVVENVTTQPGGAFVDSLDNIPFQGSVLQSVASADLNHDGFADVVAANNNGNSFGPNTVNVFINNGDGTFAAGVPYLSGVTAYKVAIADVDLDGNPDLVVTAPGGVFLLKGKGDGTFSNDSVILFTNGSPDSGPPTDLDVLRIADVNLDGFPDVIVARASFSANGIAVLLGNGDGTFQTPITTSTEFLIADLVVGDFNGDGLPDLAAGSSSSVNVMFGAGDGTFGAPAVFEANNVISLVSADLNHDGFLDIAVGSTTGIQVLLGAAGGQFQPLSPLSESSLIFTPYSLSVVDADGDGNPDLVTAGSVLFGNGDGTFGGAIPLSQQGTSAVMQDFNKDGIADIALINSCCTPGGPVTIYFGELAPRLTLTASPNPDVNSSQRKPCHQRHLHGDGRILYSV